MGKNKINRRNWLQLGLGATLGTISLKTLGCTSAATDGASVQTPDEKCLPTQYESMGPFHPNKDQGDKDYDLTRFNESTEKAKGEVIYVRGKVTDEDCNPIEGAIVLLWQANTHGKYTHEYDTNTVEDDPNFQGWGQVKTNANGEYGFKTIQPGKYVFDEETGDWRTPHIHFKVAKRGYHELITQMYFEGEELNDKDIFASKLTMAEKAQVIRKKEKEVAGIEAGASLIPFDIVLKKVRREEQDKAEFEEFVGNYAVNFKSTPLEDEMVKFFGGTRENLILTISKKDGLLNAEMPIQPLCEIYPKGKDRYEYKAFDTDIEFTRNNDNQVTGLIFHRHFEFPEIRATKL